MYIFYIPKSPTFPLLTLPFASVAVVAASPSFEMIKKVTFVFIQFFVQVWRRNNVDNLLLACFVSCCFCCFSHSLFFLQSLIWICFINGFLMFSLCKSYEKIAIITSKDSLSNLVRKHLKSNLEINLEKKISKNVKYTHWQKYKYSNKWLGSYKCENVGEYLNPKIYTLDAVMNTQRQFIQLGKKKF